MAYLPGQKFTLLTKPGQTTVWHITQAVLTFERFTPRLNILLGCWESVEDFLEQLPVITMAEYIFKGEDADIDKFQKDVYKILKREFDDFKGSTEGETTVPEPVCAICGLEFYPKGCMCNNCNHCQADIDDCECGVCDGCGLRVFNCECPDGPVHHEG